MRCFPQCKQFVTGGASYVKCQYYKSNEKRRFSAAQSLRGECNLSLYLIANRPSFCSKDHFISQIKKVVKGGVSCVQLRDYESDLATTIRTAAHLHEFLSTHGIPLFINTLLPFEAAKAVGAEGVFLEDKLLWGEARRRLGEQGVIGIPVQSMEEILEMGNKVDYLSVKVSPSNQTCPRNDMVWGMQGLRKLRSVFSYRIVAVGGLTEQDARWVYQVLNPDDGMAMAGGLMREVDPEKTAQRIVLTCQQVRGQS